MHSPQEVERVLQLVSEGWNNCQISRATAIPLTTVRNWRHGRVPNSARAGTARRRASACPVCRGGSLDEPAYAYLLGLYLGDGHIVRFPRAYVLRIVQDARYPHLIDLVGAAMSRVLSERQKVGRVARQGCIVVYAYWQHWPCLFPQHGPGRKHDRQIVLEPWQERIVAAYPRQLLRGLVHSDGCRVMNRVVKGRYAYPRYLFTNTSTDILQIFREACDAIGVRHRDAKPTMISVARRDDVAVLDAFIGPKG